MNKRPVFFFPALSPGHAPECLPDDVLFMPVGLDDCPQPGPEPGPSALFKAALPFPPQQARMVLDEMLNLGFNLGPQAAFGKKAPFLGPRIKDQELKAIRNFAEKGERLPEQDEPSSKEAEQARQDCHKALLLAHELEKRRSELGGIEKTFLEKARMLREALGEGSGLEGLEGLENGPVGPESGCGEFAESGASFPSGSEDGLGSPPAPPNWRIIAGSGLAFLPKDAILLTDSEHVLSELSEIGALGPVPASVAESVGHWPKDFLKGLSYACLPGWKLAGRGKNEQVWPWLKSDTGILVFSTKTSVMPDDR